MSKATTLTLISNLGLGDTDQTEAGIHYDDVVEELGRFEVLTEHSSTAVTVGTAIYARPTDALKILEMHGQVGLLERTTQKALQAVHTVQWQDIKGTPDAWTTAYITDGSYRLVPQPDQTDTLTVLHTEYRQDVPTWLEPALAFEVLHREYLRESDHQDIVFASLCRDIAVLLFLMVGVPPFLPSTKGA
jgi:hypothetical protein